MEQSALQDGTQIPTFATSYLAPQQQTGIVTPQTGDMKGQMGGHWRNDAEGRPWGQQQHAYGTEGLGSTGKGVLIGMLSAIGSAAVVALIVAIVYFLRYTGRGRIFLDRITRPGEFDDEQQFLREEEEALAEMDDLQRAEYHRAKGKCRTGAEVFDCRD